MSAPHFHPIALFRLVPLNGRALKVVKDPNNAHLLSKLGIRTPSLEISHVRSKVGDATTVATLGRDGDVFVPGSSISKVQCSFETETDTGVVVFHDRSYGQTTRVSGPKATPFENGRPRKVVVLPNLNTFIGMGGVWGDLVQFQLLWNVETIDLHVRLMLRQRSTLEENLRTAQTTVWTDTALLSHMGTRVHTAGPQKPLIRYQKTGDLLGSGRFGTVHSAINVDTGGLVAVKRLSRVSTMHCETEMLYSTEAYDAFKSEAETLSRLHHRHIVEFIGSQIVDGDIFEIFTELNQGSLKSLIENETSVAPSIYEPVLRQMLHAIDYLAKKGVVHRGVKPDNILYSRGQQGYHFKLGDFGSCARAGVLTHTLGTFPYMAPETSQGLAPTHKVDVWALFVTMLWTTNVHEWICNVISEQGLFSPIRGMANPDPSRRASAAQILTELYGGQEPAMTWTTPSSTTG